ITMVVDVEGIDVSGDEAILSDGQSVGYVSSGGYAHHVKKSMAMGYVNADMASPGQVLQVEIMGVMYDAEVLGRPVYDANGTHMRA
ncbi:MAG: glycine cleavage T C-terminal barrel domain-containing protein, partial [Paracoccaceae bacterium]